MRRLLSQLRGHWDLVRGSLWFIPGLMTLGAIALAVTLIWVDAHVSRSVLTRYPRFFGVSAGASRSMLSAIASSMITVAGVTFSITVVAVSQASSQYTSRVLRNFMGDRANQVVLGVFVGVFTYCIVVLRTIRGEQEIRFIPAIAVLVAFLLAIVAMAFLIFFIHHIAESLQASTLLSRIHGDTQASIDRLFPESLGGSMPEAPDLSACEWTQVRAPVTGYVQSVDSVSLLRFAEREDAIVRLDVCIGQFVARGQPLLSLSGGPGGKAQEHAAVFRIGPHRSVEQDVGFGIRQMVDLAVKALSPASNDVTTATTSIDYLSAILARLGERSIPEQVRGSDGRARILVRAPGFEELVDSALSPIRRAAAGDPAVLRRLLAGIRTAAEFTRDPERRRYFALHARLIRDSIPAAQPGSPEFADLAAEAARLATDLEAEP